MLRLLSDWDTFSSIPSITLPEPGTTLFIL